jgi:hypothetical protein
VTDIVRRARISNAARGITGLLVFDGMSFLQHLEGPPEAVGELTERILRDQRHTDIRILHKEHTDRPRCFGPLGLTYGLTSPELLTDMFSCCDGPVVMRRLEALLPQIDHEPR